MNQEYLPYVTGGGLGKYEGALGACRTAPGPPMLLKCPPWLLCKNGVVLALPRRGFNHTTPVGVSGRARNGIHGFNFWSAVGGTTHSITPVRGSPTTWSTTITPRITSIISRNRTLIAWIGSRRRSYNGYRRILIALICFSIRSCMSL